MQQNRPPQGSRPDEQLKLLLHLSLMSALPPPSHPTPSECLWNFGRRIASEERNVQQPTFVAQLPVRPIAPSEPGEFTRITHVRSLFLPEAVSRMPIFSKSPRRPASQTARTFRTMSHSIHLRIVSSHVHSHMTNFEMTNFGSPTARRTSRLLIARFDLPCINLDLGAGVELHLVAQDP